MIYFLLRLDSFAGAAEGPWLARSLLLSVERFLSPHDPERMSIWYRRCVYDLDHNETPPDEDADAQRMVKVLGPAARGTKIIGGTIAISTKQPSADHSDVLKGW